MGRGRPQFKEKESPYFKDRTGEKYTTNQGYEIEIIDCLGKEKCTVQFKSGTIINNITYINIRRQIVKNPYHPSVFGVGYIGQGDYQSHINILAYQKWVSMLFRCYNENHQVKHPTYIGCSVAEEWHNFQNFAEWFQNNYVEDFELDKDILFKGNKIYKPETCTFVPKYVNTLFTKRNKERGRLPIGVTKHANRFRVRISKNGNSFDLGTFDTPEESFEAYKTAKEVYIKEMAEVWKSKLAPQTYQAMYNYKVEITD